MVASNRPAEPPTESVQEALDKATEGGRWTGVRFNPREGTWYVPSATDGDRHYTVAIRNINVPSNSWWQRLRCNCPAGSQGLAVCWHKAAVYLRRMQQQREQRYYETAKGLTPRLENPRPTNGHVHGKEPFQPWPRRVEARREGMEGDRSDTGRSVLDGPAQQLRGEGDGAVEPSNLQLPPEGTPV